MHDGNLKKMKAIRCDEIDAVIIEKKFFKKSK